MSHPPAHQKIKPLVASVFLAPDLKAIHMRNQKFKHETFYEHIPTTTKSSNLRFYYYGKPPGSKELVGTMAELGIQFCDDLIRLWELWVLQDKHSMLETLKIDILNIITGGLLQIIFLSF